jgi:hypothetical protein
MYRQSPSVHVAVTMIECAPSLIAPSVFDAGVTMVSVAPLLADCIRRITTRRRKAQLVLHP